MDKHRLDCSDFETSSKRQRQEERALSNELIAAQHPSEAKLDSELALCDDCKTVDWSCLPTLAADGLMEAKKMRLRFIDSTFEELRTSSCRVCAILSIIKPPYLDGKRCVLNALPLSRQVAYDGSELSRSVYSEHLNRVSSCTVLAVDEPKNWGKLSYGPLSLAVVRLGDLETRRITSSSLDYNRLRGLVDMCEKEHKMCHAAESRPNVLGLEVIDTKRHEVVKAPDQCKYLALSYVWGKQTSDNSVHDIQHCPAVIKDAISVTNSLGFNYLWVDRYCISDSTEKHRMISQMDQIYANASITLIAASDGDTEVGLCGVSKPRQLQRHVDIQDVALLELPLGHEALTSSKWASRAWTYQEGYLSTKRLIFTTTQVLFLCNGSYGAESLQRLVDSPCCTNNTRAFAHLIPNFTRSTRKFSIKDLLKQVQEYSERDLTRSSDSLNAFLGVLSYYAKNSANSMSPVLQLPWGLFASANKSPRMDNFSLYFFWTHRSTATRRSDFPSWSWIGWGGALESWGAEMILRPRREVNERYPIYFERPSYLDWKISVKEEDGRVLEMHDLVTEEFEARKFKYRLYQPGPKQLQISCMVIPVSFQKLNLTEDQRKKETHIQRHNYHDHLKSRNLPNGVHPTLQVWKGIYAVKDRADLRLDQKLEQQDCIMGLISPISKSRYGNAISCILLVRQVGEGLYERVGVLNTPRASRFFGDTVYIDASGSVLDQIYLVEGQWDFPFADTAESRTICLI